MSVIQCSKYTLGSVHIEWPLANGISKCHHCNVCHLPLSFLVIGLPCMVCNLAKTLFLGSRILHMDGNHGYNFAKIPKHRGNLGSQGIPSWYIRQRNMIWFCNCSDGNQLIVACFCHLSVKAVFTPNVSISRGVFRWGCWPSSQCKIFWPDDHKHEICNDAIGLIVKWIFAPFFGVCECLVLVTFSFTFSSSPFQASTLSLPLTFGVNTALHLAVKPAEFILSALLASPCSWCDDPRIPLRRRQPLDVLFFSKLLKNRMKWRKLGCARQSRLWIRQRNELCVNNLVTFSSIEMHSDDVQAMWWLYEETANCFHNRFCKAYFRRDGMHRLFFWQTFI